MTQDTRRTVRWPRLAGGVLLLVLLVAMVLDTRFVSPAERAAANPQAFDAGAEAESLFETATDLEADAAPLGEVIAALQDDATAAAEQYGAARPNDTTFVFTVTATATVTEVSDRSIVLQVEGVPQQTTVSLSLGPAITGTVLRDALGFGFADAPSQSAFQGVGDELKTLMQAQVDEGLGGQPPAPGDELSILGVLSVTGSGGPQPPEKPVAVQPVTVEVSS